MGFSERVGLLIFFFFFAGTFSGSTSCQSYFHQSNRTGILLVIINLTFVYPLTTRRVDNRVPYAAFLVGSDQV
jgi:cyclic lactone autoinducer peptide